MTISRNSIPKFDAFAGIAAACSYEVVIRSPEHEITMEYR